MPRRDALLLVQDMIQCIDWIQGYVAELDFDDFCSDRKTLDAVVRNLEVIGEAARALPDELKTKTPSVDWPAVIGLRNRLIHEYFDVSPSIVWQVVVNELPRFKQQLIGLVV